MHGIHFQLFYEESEKNFTVFLPYAPDPSRPCRKLPKMEWADAFFVLK